LAVIRFKHRGSFNKTEKFLKAMRRLDVKNLVEREVSQGVQALKAATPKDSGIAAESWGYEIRQNGRSVKISWINVDIENGFPVAVAVQFGYATGTGGWVEGRDYINPAMKPVFDRIVERVWKVVTSA
jgi:hypothetical protein